MKQFLRFQISGLTAVFWAALFTIPYVDWQALKDASEDLLTFIGVVAIALALPLGTIVHQISITVLSPFRRWRFFNKRKVLDDLELFAKEQEFVASDQKNQFALVYAQAWRGNECQKEWPNFDLEYIRAEISNRYSYYYVRIDNGLLSPLLGLGISRIVVSIDSSVIAKTPVCQSMLFLISASAILTALLMVWYVPALLREVDDIERLLIRTLRSNMASKPNA